MLHICSTLLVALLLLKIVVDGRERRWHAYDARKNPPKTEQCREFDHEQATANLSRIIDDYRLWPDAWDASSLSDNPNATVYGFGRAMREIWQHQHPKDCSTAKFMISYTHSGGIGCVVHVAGAPLGLAIELGRVYLQHPFSSSSRWEWDVPFCKEHSPFSTDIDCYFEPWASCTIYDALGPNATIILHEIASKSYNYEFPKGIDYLYIPNGASRLADLSSASMKKIRDLNNINKVLIIGSVIPVADRGFVPSIFKSMLDCSLISHSAYYYWWRAIAVAYMMRPKRVVVDWIHNNTLQGLDHRLPPAYVSVYVRRGDKAMEMKLAPLTQYTDAVNMLYDQKLLAREQEQKVLFVASEDSQVMHNMTIWSHDHNYSMYNTNLFDRSGLYAEAKVGKNGKRSTVHHPLEYLSMLLNIHHLIQGEGFVCTMASNFCRLVDELRATVGGRADRPYLDLSPETCGSHIPCLDHINRFGW